jgi:uncharacterized protein YdaU (DUF1376 family)
MAALPYMQFYPRDFLADTMHLSPTQVGIYIRILSRMWLLGGSLDDEERALAQSVGLDLGKFRTAFPAVRKMLTVEGDKLTQKRLRKDFDETSETVGKKSYAGKRSAEERARRKAEEEAAAPDRHDQPEQSELNLDEDTEEVSKSSVKARFLAEDWEPSEEDIAFAKREGLPEAEIRRETLKFKNYWLERRDAKAKKVKWSRAWQSWVIKAASDFKRFNRPPPPRSSGGSRI